LTNIRINLAEGHFIERSWAGLLSQPLTLDETIAIESLLTKTIDEKKNGFVGQIVPI